MMTYNYDDCSVERDFVFKKVEGDCRVDPNRTTTIGVFCRACPHYSRTEGRFVLCRYHKEDDAGSEEIWRRIREKFVNEALNNYC